ncbi:membrane peptidoglycan carboxypeptidase [Frondihabitans sp. PhB188]|uniref:transglycosylase domain-containing protein n=1 Tax=Frondihabitans sp. PhB188 TaxID=2485200 RepID=UPI000F461507|nr:transglycosylase domain-containing protein [Frondihabitans sp. PhB188]ROQ39943.1 membrane peptidoglycan carboxypeptidase [Frondihabitans sp. PhB188]
MPHEPHRLRSALTALAGFIALSAVAGLLVSVGVAPGVVVAGRAAGAAATTFDSIPEFIEIQKLQQRNVLYAERGGEQVPFATLYSENRVTVGWDDVAQTVKDAAVAGEDHGFYEHGAVDLTSLARAAAGSALSRELGAAGGGSTLTMQLVRNILVAQAEALDDPAERKAAYKKATELSTSRKIAEMKFAIGLEKRYTKDEILLAYLNIAYFGDNTYGVEAASQRYFGKNAKALAPSEAASLVATVQNPERRNLSSASHYKANKARRDVILEAMHEHGKISAATLGKAKAKTVRSSVHLTSATQGCLAVGEIGARQWCDLIRRMVKTMPALGETTTEREHNWRLGGYEIHTTLDLDLTATAKQQVDTYAPKDEVRYDLGGVVVSVEADSGRVIVMTQNKDFDDTRDGGGPTTTAVNYAVDQKWGSSTGFQPGSTYKPFTLIDWLNKGHLLGETVNATPRDFSPMRICGAADFTTFDPKNDDFGNPGTVTARQATARSINTAFAAMAQKLDLCDIRDVAASLGVHAADGADLVAYPSSVIGSGNTVAPVTMAAAFAGIANGGVYCEPIYIDSIVDGDGKKLAGHRSHCERVMDAGVAAKVASAMQGVFTGGTATSANPRDGVPILGKTGTTDHAEQTWLVGGSSKVVTASWVGNISGHQNQYRIYGGYGAMNQQRLTIWRNVQARINAVYGGDAFAAPAPEYIAPPPAPPRADDADDDAPPADDTGRSDSAEE